MSWENIHVGDYGWVGKLTIVQDEVVVPIETYSGFSFIFTDPLGETSTKTAAFDTDGTDGTLKYQVEEGVIDMAGNWQVQARISKVGVLLTSDPLEFYAEPSPS